MPTNPFIDIWHFLTGNTNDYLHQGNWRYVILALFWILLLAGTAIACKNWQDDPEQRTGRHLGIWLIRMLIGCMSGRIALKRAGSIFHNLVGAYRRGSS